MSEVLDKNLDDGLLGDLLFGPARMLRGSGLEEEELIRVALGISDQRTLFVVGTWIILDVILPSSELKELEEEGLKSTVIYANRVLFTTHPQAVSSYGVVSGYQADLDGCIFQSKDALYILAGRGARKHVSLPALTALQQSMGALAQ